MTIQVLIQDAPDDAESSVMEIRIGEWFQTWMAKRKPVDLINSEDFTAIIREVVARYVIHEIVAKSNERLT